MADKTSQRSIWVTLVAAVATVVVILGIAAGPTIVGCATTPSGLGACMRETLADIGLLRQQPTDVSSPVEKVAVVQAPVATPEPEVTELPTVKEPVEQAVATIEPRLGLVRAEPDGSLVIAGSAAPGAEVEVYANGALLGRVVTESSGDWVLIPDVPLPPGGVEISVAVPATGQMAAQSVVVVIQDNRTTEPLVVASTPGQASKILQGLETSSADQPVETGATQEAMDKPEPAAEEQPVEAVVEMPMVEPEAEAADEQSMEVATAEPVAEMKAEPAVATLLPPSIDAIEVDGDLNFFAGSGAEGTTIRLYVDDIFIADTIVKGGRWLVETARNYLTSPTQRVRVDMLRPNTAEVSARAEVNFEIDLIKPEMEQPTVVAEVEQPEAEPQIDPAMSINQAASDNASAALAEPPTIASETKVATAQDTQVVAPTPETQKSETVEPVARVADETGMVAEEEPASEQTAVVTEPDATMESASEGSKDVAMREDMASGTEDDVPTLTAVPVEGSDGQRFASGKAIIRHGDNLWAIASRVYGSGYRYINIYRANRGQIRDPNLIYPGQVFELPTEE